MINCRVCGAELSTGAVACWGCGAIVEAPVPPATSSDPASTPPPQNVPQWEAVPPAQTPARPDAPAASTAATPVPATQVQPSSPTPAPPVPAPLPDPPARRRGFRPVWLFGIAAVLAGCAAILWVILHFTVGTARGSGDSGVGARATGQDAAARTERETLTGTWGAPWGGGRTDQPSDTKLDPETLPSKGAIEPVLALVEFGDYECEYTQRVERTLESILARFDREVRLVFVHDPLAIHDHAVLAAQAAEAARLQGKFGEMHQRLLEAKGQVDRDGVLRFARDIGLDTERFQRDLDGAAKERVAAMMGFAKAHGLTATPHFVIGGHPIEGARPEDLFVRVIEAALAEAKARLESGKSRRQVYEESLAFLGEG